MHGTTVEKNVKAMLKSIY